MFTATDLKQYLYCPRILYYHHCLPDIRPITYKMEAGIRAHESESAREARRSLRPYGLKEAERQFDVWVESKELNLCGRIDLVLKTPDGKTDQVCPVEFKMSHRAGNHWKIQLAAYALLLEDNWNVKAKQGYIYLIAQRRAEPIKLTTRLKKRVEQALAQMAEISLKESWPAAQKQRGKCRNCEFRRFCNDV